MADNKIKSRASKYITSMLLISFYILSISPGPLFANEKCPQKRKTPGAPNKFLTLKNPLPPSTSTLKSGKNLFQNQAKPIACKTCHGITGNGKGDPDFESTPPARNFTCAKIMGALPDGQLFWIIRNGSPTTSMFAYSDLSDDQIWQMIHYIRQFSKKNK